MLVTTWMQHSCASSCSFRVRASLDTSQGHAIMRLTKTVDAAGALFRNNIKPFLQSCTRRLNKVSLNLCYSVSLCSTFGSVCSVSLQSRNKLGREEGFASVSLAKAMVE